MIVQLHAFEDSDIDGVSDANDLCPDTSFEDTVDENGCPENQNYWGEISLSLGADINYDKTSSTDYNFFMNYSYKRWDIALYSSQQSSMDTNSNSSTSTDDIYLSLGYSLDIDNFSTKLSFGSKLAIGGDEVSTGENDYFSTLNLNYIINEKIALISQLSYTLTGDSKEINYNNTWGYSFGVGYMVSSNYYSSILYQRSNSIYQNSDNYQVITLSNSYNFSDNIFGILNYSRGLDKLSYDHTISLKLGATFE